MDKYKVHQKATLLKLYLIFFGMLCFVAQNSNADKIRIAVASNFAAPIKAIVKEFEVSNPHKVSVSIGSSGKLYTQILNGAPYDIFFSADQEKPLALQKAKLAEANNQFTYAIGKLVLWSSDNDNTNDVLAKLKSGRFNKLAIANPRLAPYGMAAMQVLEGLKLNEIVQAKLVLGESAGQAWQYTVTGHSELGFISLSQLIQAKKNQIHNYWLVPQAYYSAIKQDAIVLKRGKSNPAVTAFIKFLQSEQARELITAYGYELDSKR